MASLVTEKEPQKGDVWRYNGIDQTGFSFPEPEYVYITEIERLWNEDYRIKYKQYFNDDNAVDFEEKNVPYDTFVKEYTYDDRPISPPNELVLTRNKDVEIFNLSDSGSGSGSEKEGVSLSELGLTIGEPLNNKPSKKLTTIKKQTPKKVKGTKPILKKKRATEQKIQGTGPKKRKQKRRIHQRREKIHWEFLSRDYNTLFYPKYKGKVVPQVMTITKVVEKELDKRTKQRKKYKSIKRTKVYIFAIKDPNTNIDKRIETWTAWRKDRDAVNNWIKQIKRIKKKCKTDLTKSNFLKALQKSFTIDKRGSFKETKLDPFKEEMAICYVHFIKDRGTDYTFPKFYNYFKANCDALNKLFDTLKAKKFEENLNNVKDINNNKEVSQANTGLNSFASDIFHKDIEYVKDETFDVLGEKEEQTKQQLARMFDIDISTGNTMGVTNFLMAKLKF